jgi:hypothetical protein
MGIVRILCWALVGCISAQVVRHQEPGLEPWSGLGGNPEHTARAQARAQALGIIRWQTPVDLAPQYSGNELLIHYGSPLVTSHNTVIVPVKTGATGGLRVDARDARDGKLKWSATTDYVFPPADWTPEFGPVLTPETRPRLFYPGAGGTVYFRDEPDSNRGSTGQIAFYGMDTYAADRQAYNTSVMINTPLTADAGGNLYFGFLVTGQNPSGLSSGIARISASGEGTWVSAAAAASNPSIAGVVYNCAPALNSQTGTLYVAVSTAYNGAGYLLALNSATLAPIARAELKDPATGMDALLSSDGSASPTIGPDGDVYFGVLESSGENHDRGWLLHFDGRLSVLKTPGAFGWDDTASIVPSAMVPSYQGASSYLVMTKYNDYHEAGGSGINRIAVLDPNTGAADSVTGTIAMRAVLTVAGVTPDGALPAVKEWCINSAAVDPLSGSILAGSEDGTLYRWNLSSNTLSESIVLTPGLGEAYTPTIVGPDGTVYAINNATLFAVGDSAQ